MAGPAGARPVAINGIPVTVYGIPNCDQVKKARTWLDAHQITYAFHDFKQLGLSRELAEIWFSAIDSDILINRKGSTWRALDDVRKALLDQVSGAMAEKIAVVIESPSLIKRPVLDANGTITVGFKPDHYTTLFKSLFK
jgi:arsenate reductase (glutaredoxin)